MSLHVVVGGGRILVPRAAYGLYLGGATSAALIEREGRVHLLPLSGPVAGGLLLKQRNLHGDRVLVAPEFLARCGIGALAPDREHPVRWIAEAGALWIEGLAADPGRAELPT